MLKAYKRGKTWWAKGKITFNGRAITNYYRCSTGATTEQGAQDWITVETDRQRKRHIVGEEQVPLNFADVVALYDPSPDMAKYLVPILDELGEMPVKSITPLMVKELGQRLMPDAATSTWQRWIIVPTSAVINHAHQMLGGRCPPIRIAGYSRAERIAQDKRRGKKSGVKKTPGSWHWLLNFRKHADPARAALALTMFATGARIGQALAMHPAKHLDLQNARVCIPGAKGSDDRWIKVPMELVVELANLQPKIPRGWPRSKDNLRVFGFSSRQGVTRGWHRICDAAGIEHITPHGAGRHGFGQEMLVRQGVDEKAAGRFGGWHDTALMQKTYTHAEGHEEKILAAFRTGLVQAEEETGLKLMANKG